MVKKSINGEELLSELRLLMKKLFPLLFKSVPDNDPLIVLNPFPVQEDVFPILLSFIEFACSYIILNVLDEPLSEYPLIFNSM